MKNICREHSDDLLDEVIHKENIAHSDKPKICKAQQGLTGSSKGDIIRAENSSTSYSCAQGFYLHSTICELGPKHWSAYSYTFNHCLDLLSVFGFQFWLLKNLWSLHGGIPKSGATFSAGSKCHSSAGVMVPPPPFSNLYLKSSSKASWFPAGNNRFLWTRFRIRFLAFSVKPWLLIQNYHLRGDK